MLSRIVMFATSSVHYPLFSLSLKYIAISSENVSTKRKKKMLRSFIGPTTAAAAAASSTPAAVPTS